ncbi:MAG: cupredoxin domain-containing protein [Ilumatobacteraceae bacterium]
MRFRCALLALALPIAVACSSDNSGSAAQTAASTATTPAATTPAAPASTTAAAPAGGGAVAIVDFKFGPAEIHVPVGGSVTWTNNDAQQHTATSTSGAFDAGAMQPGASATVDFANAGSFTYICSFHPFMMGTVVVG